MTYGIYAVRDVKTGFLSPTLDVNGDSAIRNFEHAVHRADSLFYTHASDYSLYRIGDYDTDTGTIIPAVPVVHIVDADALLRKE